MVFGFMLQKKVCYFQSWEGRSVHPNKYKKVMVTCFSVFCLSRSMPAAGSSSSIRLLPCRSVSEKWHHSLFFAIELQVLFLIILFQTQKWHTKYWSLVIVEFRLRKQHVKWSEQSILEPGELFVPSLRIALFLFQQFLWQMYQRLFELPEIESYTRPRSLGTSTMFHLPHTVVSLKLESLFQRWQV